MSLLYTFMKTLQFFLLDYQLRGLRFELIFPKALLTTYYLKLTLNVLKYLYTMPDTILMKNLGTK